MPLWFVILLDIAVIWFFFGNNIEDLLRTGLAKKRHALKEFEKSYKATLERDLDILPPEKVSFLEELIANVHEVRTKGDKAAVEECLAVQENPATTAKLPRPKPGAAIGTRAEMLLVVLAVAFGIRALFLQPFKIPTGSMQVTLFGIHFEEADRTPLPTSVPAKVWSYLNYSRRTMDAVVRANGYFDPESLTPVKSLPLLPRTAFRIGDQTYLLPGEPDNVLQTLVEQAKNPTHAEFFQRLRIYRYFGERAALTQEEREKGYFRQGDVLAQGYLSLGDHLFVNRTSLCWREPRRGDVMVFVTDGLTDPDGTGFGGRFYIKRLVGLPGDELLIRDHKLWLKKPGDADFQPYDEVAKGFRRVHSCQGGYHGYANMPHTQYLTNGQDSFRVPEGQYFMLGDNSENSKDSRYWGTVPRRNLVGTACVVWWPFTRRWAPPRPPMRVRTAFRSSIRTSRPSSTGASSGV
ncbi:MAG: signal peptidase I [Victivallales bacterium]|nr:signal peptidase I [Victivallales bacterium]